MHEYVNPAQINGFINAEMGITYPKTGRYKDFPFTAELIQIKKYSTIYNKKSERFVTKYALAKHGWGRICPDAGSQVPPLSLYTHQETMHSDKGFIITFE